MDKAMGLIIDLFAGGGGASTGIEAAIGRAIDIAVNHDPEAIRMYKVNHPETRTLTEDVFDVDLEFYVNGKSVDLLWGSPDCTHFSKARGTKPKDQGIRVLPWAVHKHCKKLVPEMVIMENVEEIQTWGDLDEHGRPIKEEAGKEYRNEDKPKYVIIHHKALPSSLAVSMVVWWIIRHIT